MKDFWTKFGCLLTGWNYQILKTCTEASHKQLKKYTSAILILIIIWALVGYSFADRYIKADVWLSSIVAIIFVLIVIQIERQIILTVGKSPLLSVFRIVIALIMAVLGSAILDQIIFKDDIDKKMIEIVDRQVNDQLPNRLLILDTELNSLQHQLDSIGKRNLWLNEEISKKPFIISSSKTVTSHPILQEDGSIIDEEKTTVQTNPIENPKTNELKANTAHLEKLHVRHEGLLNKKLQAEDELRSELEDKKGFLEELGAIIEILKESTIALIFYVVLLVFLISLELFVVLSKAGKNKSDYDLIVEHQLDQKKKVLEKLVK